MDSKVLALVALLTLAIWSPETDAKPISLVERCWCRSTLNTVPQRSIREIKFLHTPSCPFQVIIWYYFSGLEFIKPNHLYPVGNKKPKRYRGSRLQGLESAKLKNNREVCINPKTKWLQQYLKNAINK
uniref:Chemokine ligand 12b n=1 Tax=Ctenopharyngodon idella TaxID=7959 RepID=A0A345D732_CTEID|nr:chemokine ligand 12b [Ctenopharyngodon idella]